MNRALFFLWFTLLKRRLLQFSCGLRRPTNLIGFVAVIALLAFMFHYRRHEAFGYLVRRESLIGGALIMVCGSLFKGFLQRGLVFDLPDLELLLTGPFSKPQIILYQLLPSYLFAPIEGLAFLAL